MRLAAVLIVFCWPPRQGTAQLQRFATYCLPSSSEIELLKDLQDGALDSRSLVEAALVAAGHTDHATLEGFQRRFLGHVHDCRRQLDTELAYREQAAVIYRYMHGEILRAGFEPDRCDLGQTITDGRYNCLTATILFQALCEEFDLSTEVIWQPAHVSCRVGDPTSAGVLVETTLPRWHDATSPGEAMDQAPARTLNEAGLIAKVFYNRGVTAMRQQRFAVALSTTWASCLLDPEDDQAQANLRACLNNWALASAVSGDMNTARQLLQEGLRLDPEYLPFQRNQAFFSINGHLRDLTSPILSGRPPQ